MLAVSRPDHADCCVQLARLMITAIGAVRSQCREPDLDMRIGNNITAEFAHRALKKRDCALCCAIVSETLKLCSNVV